MFGVAGSPFSPPATPRGRPPLFLALLPPKPPPPPRRIHQPLLAGKERMAVRADFHRDVALMGRPGHKCVAARTMHAHFMVIGMNCCLHSRFQSQCESLDSTG